MLMCESVQKRETKKNQLRLTKLVPFETSHPLRLELNEVAL